MTDFFNMGNYAPYILSAMGAALFFMLFEPILLIMKRRSVLQDIRRLKRLEERQQR